MSAVVTAPTITCPRCARGSGVPLPLEAVERSGVTVDYCQGCNGIWLDAGEVTRIVGTRLAARRVEATEALECPACAAAGDARALDRRRVTAAEAIDVDTCGGCGGAWLDAGELQSLRRHARSGSSSTDVVSPPDEGTVSPPPGSAASGPADVVTPSDTRGGLAALPAGATSAAATHPTPRPAPATSTTRRGGTAVLVGALTAVVALGFLGHGLNRWQAAVATKTWTPVEGTVETARIDERRRTEHVGRNDRRRTRHEYRQRVTYSYAVDGETHRGERITAQGEGWRSVRPSQRYRVGETVTVFHDPDDPSRAVLRRGTTLHGLGQLLFAAVALVYGVLVMLGRAPLPTFRAERH